MHIEVFSDRWARACAAAINANEAYRAAATAWEGAVILHVVARDPAGERRVYLDLWRGECRQARVGTEEDDASARYILAGEGRTWQQLLSGSTPPMMAIMTGRLRLTKGTMTELLPHVESARQLVVSVASVTAVFPDWA